MSFGPPVGGWFDAEGHVLDAVVFDFGPRTDVAKSASDDVLATDSDGLTLQLNRAYPIMSSQDGRPTRNSHGRQMVVTTKTGDSGVFFACWQAGTTAPQGVVYSYSTDGITWSAPAQISSRTGFYPAIMIRPDTNDIFVFYSGRGGGSSVLYGRALAYTGTPGLPSWAVGAEITIDAAGTENLSVAATSAGYAHVASSNTSGPQLQINRFANVWDHTTMAISQEGTLTAGTGWMDIVRTENLGGWYLAVAQSGGQFRVFTCPDDAGADPTYTQRDSFLGTDSEEFSIVYNDATNQLVLAYANGGNINVRIYTWDGVTLTLSSGPTVISTGTCHSPCVVADSDGTSLILWIHESPSANQRKIKVARTGALTTVYDLDTDQGSNAWHDLTAPRTTGVNNMLCFAVSETVDTSNVVFLCTVPIPVFKTVADTGTFTEGTMGVEVLFGETLTGSDDPQQTKQVGPGFCQDGDRTLFDGWMFDTANLDENCVPFDTTERWTLTETIEHGPGVAETLTATESVFLSDIGMDETVTGTDALVIEQTVAETVTGTDSPTVDENPIGDQNDTVTTAEDVLVEVLATETGTETVSFDVAITVDEPVAGADALDLDNGGAGDQNDTATGADEFSISVAVEEVLQAIDDWVVEPQGANDTITAVEAFDVAVTVDETASGADSDPSQDGGMSKDSPDTITFTDAATVERNYGLSVRLGMVKGNVKLRMEGARTSAITSRNDPD